ncbi:MAG: hypothetical protein GY789_12550 [Hyphomicrobiales bacterium]|nr:hypothetical protein [Hyphomicrobiales bacterium]MCP5000680.1 hypothetical protein [Hyphomicrobiales bacterium]
MVIDLHEPDAPTAVVWEKKGYTYQGFVGNYATDLFSLNNCVFTHSMPKGYVAVKKYHHESESVDECIVQLPGGGRQIILHLCNDWGNTSPDKLYEDRQFYNLSPDTGLEQIVASYKKAARGTLPAASVATKIPADISSRVGVHVRLMDKISHEENAYEMTADSWRSTEAAGLKYIEHCIANGERLFLCSDDLRYRASLVEQIRQRGGDVAVADFDGRTNPQPGFGALVVFFALSRCKRIVQMTKYSTFSIAAAIAGGKQLVHLASTTDDVGNRHDIWRQTLDVIDFNGR